MTTKKRPNKYIHTTMPTLISLHLSNQIIISISMYKTMKYTDIQSHFQPLEFADRGSETQTQVVENLNTFT